MKKKQLLLCIVVVMSSVKGFSQQSINALGGDVISTTGSMSYSVGQTFAKSISTNNYFVTEGVHQPYEISTLGTDNNQSILLELKVFPNPTSSVLFLKNSNFSKNSSSRYELFDVSGKLIKSNKVLSQETQIDLQKENTGIYILRVFDGNKILKSFKIIKN